MENEDSFLIEKCLPLRAIVTLPFFFFLMMIIDCQSSTLQVQMLML
jgi:hypothetical protein